MLYLQSKLELSALRSAWDERTSPARFAGNDDLMDNIFVASRRGDRVFLVRRARGAWDPFATVFRGKLVADGDGSAIRGHFSKRVIDYLLLLAIATADILFYMHKSAAGEATASVRNGCILLAVILLLLAIPLRSARRRYRSFLKEITDTDKTDLKGEKNTNDGFQ